MRTLSLSPAGRQPVKIAAYLAIEKKDQFRDFTKLAKSLTKAVTTERAARPRLSLGRRRLALGRRLRRRSRRRLATHHARPFVSHRHGGPRRCLIQERRRAMSWAIEPIINDEVLEVIADLQGPMGWGESVESEITETIETLTIHALDITSKTPNELISMMQTLLIVRDYVRKVVRAARPQDND